MTYLPEFMLGGYKLHINVLLTLFGAFLVYAGIKSAVSEDDDDEEKDFSRSPGAKFVRWLFPRVTEEFEGDKFFVKKAEYEKLEEGEPYALKKGESVIKSSQSDKVKGIIRVDYLRRVVTYATPLLIVAGVIEFTDLVFAVDSIPAIFAIAPKDPFILYSSNIFAILGLRSLYFLLANFIGMFRYLKYGLAVILSFIGVKMLIAPIVHISSPLSLGIVVGVLILSTLASIVIKPKEDV